MQNTDLSEIAHDLKVIVVLTRPLKVINVFVASHFLSANGSLE